MSPTSRCPILGLIFTGCAPLPPLDRFELPVGTAEELDEVLLDSRREFDQPAMAIAVFRVDGDPMTSVSGTRESGLNAPVQRRDRFHVGSTTKSMTALIVAQLVDEGTLRYDSRIDEILELPMHPSYAGVTVRDLLLSRSGLLAWQRLDSERPEDVAMLDRTIPSVTANPMEQRREVARYVLSLDPRFEPGSRAEYSNVGWSVLGHLLETVTGQAYEDLLQERIFAPLSMVDSRVGGWPASEEEPDQPRGHYALDTDGSRQAQALDDPYVLPSWMNPAGGVHCSIEDYARYAQEVLRGLRGDGQLLSTSGYAAMHEVHAVERARDLYQGQTSRKRQSLGYGWALVPVGDGFLSVADGSAGTFYARLAILPELEVGFAGFTNAGDGEPALSLAIRRSTGLPW